MQWLGPAPGLSRNLNLKSLRVASAADPAAGARGPVKCSEPEANESDSTASEPSHRDESPGESESDRAVPAATALGFESHGDSESGDRDSDSVSEAARRPGVTQVRDTPRLGLGKLESVARRASA